MAVVIGHSLVDEFVGPHIRRTVTGHSKQIVRGRAIGIPRVDRGRPGGARPATDGGR